MIAELLIMDGTGLPVPLTVRIAQVVIRNDHGTPILVGSAYGGDDSQSVAKIGDKDFQRLLRAAGVREQVTFEDLQLPGPPAGARLIAGPTY